MAKQPAKGRKSPAKPRKTTQSRKTTAESVKVSKPQVDVIPAEVHKKPTLVLKNAEVPVAAEEKPAIVETEKVAAATVPEPTPEPAQRTSIFVPLILGGLIAGGIGFGIAKITQTQIDSTIPNQIAQQANALTGHESEVADLSSNAAALATELTTLRAGLADVDARVTALENLPRGEGVGSVPAIAAYETELDALRAQIADLTGVAQTELEAARAEAASIEENATAAARAAAGRAALARLQTGMENGAPLGAALADLEDAIGGSAPDALLAAQDGVPTLVSLQDQFPEFARAALATARSEGVSGEDTGGIGAFLRNQFDVRSVTPQEGATADAILSRAQAAVRAGRLSEALLEISALPEVARAEMSEWLAQAELRADAIAAVDILSTSLSDN